MTNLDKIEKSINAVVSNIATTVNDTIKEKERLQIERKALEDKKLLESCTTFFNWLKEDWEHIANMLTECPYVYEKKFNDDMFEMSKVTFSNGDRHLDCLLKKYFSGSIKAKFDDVDNIIFWLEKTLATNLSLILYGWHIKCNYNIFTIYSSSNIKIIKDMFKLSNREYNATAFKKTIPSHLCEIDWHSCKSQGCKRRSHNEKKSKPRQVFMHDIKSVQSKHGHCCTSHCFICSPM